MKTVYRISIILNIIGVVYLLIFGAKVLLEDYFMKAGRESLPQDSYYMEETKEAGVTMDQITCDTVYMISEYDISTGKQEVYQEKLPESFVGMTRIQLVEWIDQYNLSASLEDLEQGFCSVELLSFSPQEIRVRKRIDTNAGENISQVRQVPDIFVSEKENNTVSENGAWYGCILAQDGFLTVYDAQRRHVILYTDISLFDLSETVQQEIMNGKYVATQEELFQLLESYSS